MKKNVRMLYAFFAALWICYGLYMILELDWTLLDVKILFFVAIALTILTVILYCVLLYKKLSRKSIYISCGTDDKESLDYIIKMIPRRIKVDDTLSLEPGTHLMSSLTEKINKSSVCLMIVSHKLTKLQRLERNAMMSLGKECVPIMVDEEFDLKSFKNIVPIFLKDKNFKNKLLDILMKYSILI